LDPTCYWRSNRTLSIYTGSNPTIQVRTENTNADKIVIRDETLRSTAGNSYFTSGFVLLAPPSTILQVNAALNAPRTLGICDDLVLDGTSSLGGGGRSLSYEWTVYSDYDTTAMLLQMNAESRAANNRVDTIQIPTDSLLVGGRWTFTLRVSNWLGASDSTTVEVQKASQPVPLVDIVGLKVVNIRPSDPLTLTASAQLPDDQCPEASSQAGNVILYQWTQTGGPALDFVGEVAQTANARRFQLPTNTLWYDQSYTFQVETWLQANVGIRTSASVEVNVGFDDLTMADMGADRTIFTGAPFTITVNCDDLMLDSSLDSNERAWQFAWDCVLSNGELCPFALLNYIYTTNERTLSFPEGMLEAIGGTSTSYELSVRVSREPMVDPRYSTAIRERSTSVAIRATSTPTIEVSTSVRQIKTLGRNMLDSTLPTYLECLPDEAGLATAPTRGWAGVTEAAQVYYKWRVVEGVLDGSLDDNLSPTVGDSTSKEVLINPEALIVGSVYVFACDILVIDPPFPDFVWNGLPYEGGATGSTQTYPNEINGPPSGGTADIYPLSGEELIHIFTITATGWTDPDGGLSYAFYTAQVPDPDFSADLTVLVGEQQLSPRWSGRLPNGESTYVFVKVQDVYGAFVYAPVIDTSGRQVLVAVRQVTTTTVSQLLSVKREMGATKNYFYSSVPTVASRRLLSDEMVPAPYPASLRRSLLQDMSGAMFTSRQVQFAGELKELVWDPAVGIQDADEAFVFMSVWGRLFGGNLTAESFQQTMLDSPCLGNPELRAMKDTIFKEMSSMDIKIAARDEYLQQFTCSTYQALATPADISPSVQDLLFEMVYERKIAASLESFAVFPRTATTTLLSVGVTEVDRSASAASNCMQYTVSLLMRVVEAKCQVGANFEQQLEQRNQTQMDRLYLMSQDLAQATLLKRVPRQTPITIISHGLFADFGEFSFTAQIREFVSGFVNNVPLELPPTLASRDLDNATLPANRRVDFSGSLPGVMAFSVNVSSTMVPPGGPVRPREQLYMIAYSYSGVNPLPLDALQDEQTGESLFGVNAFVNRNNSLEAIAASGFVEVLPEMVAREEIRALELQAVNPGRYYTFSLQAYNLVTRLWGDTGMKLYPGSLWYHLTDMSVLRGFSPYLEVAQSPPPPPSPPPLPPTPPAPKPPPSPPKMQDDLTAIVVIVAMGVAVIMALVIFFIYRRRRQRKAHTVRPRSRVDPTGPTPSDPLLSPDDEDLDEFMDEDPEAGDGDGLGDMDGFEDAGGDSEGEHEIM